MLKVILPIFHLLLIHLNHLNFLNNFINKMAEREGFEPSKRFPVYTLSKRAPSTTRPPLLIKIINKFNESVYELFVGWKLIFFHIFLNFFIIFFNIV